MEWLSFGGPDMYVSGRDPCDNHNVTFIKVDLSYKDIAHSRVPMYLPYDTGCELTDFFHPCSVCVLRSMFLCTMF